MKRAIAERNLVIFLFIAVLVIFSMAERDSKKLVRLYTSVIDGGSRESLVEHHYAAPPAEK